MPYPTPATLRFVELAERFVDQADALLVTAQQLDDARKDTRYMIETFTSPITSEWRQRKSADADSLSR